MIEVLNCYEKIINNYLKKNNNTNFLDIKNKLIEGLSPMLIESTGRMPIILPIIMDIRDFKPQQKTPKANIA